MSRAVLLAAVLLLAVTGASADDHVLTASTALNAVQPQPPTGSIALTSVTDALASPRDSPLMAKNTFAVGNNVVITKSNIIIRKDTADSGDSAALPATKLLPLALAIENVVARSTAETANASCDAVLGMLGVTPSSAAFASLRGQVMALLPLRGDRRALRQRVAALMAAASQVDEAKALGNDSQGSVMDEDGERGEDATPQVVGYRTLFRWSGAGRPYVGWRYPLRYWVLYGSSRLGGACGLGRAIGDFFYC